jgi:hypothetical protein
MKLTDAAELGRTITTMCVGDWMGCYIGAAANAVGIVPVIKLSAINFSYPNDRIEAVKDYWPWLAPNMGERLCEIVALYDHGMSFDKLNAYVKTIEPQCGCCNSFDCCCTRAEVAFEEALKDPSVWETTPR